MADFTINGVAYKSKLFDGKLQIHMMKRLLPSFTALAGAAGEIDKIAFPDRLDPTDEAALSDEEKTVQADQRTAAMARLSLVLAPVTEHLAKLSDADVDFILDNCVSVTERRAANSDAWVPLMRSGDDADRKFATRLQIAWYVVSENFQDAFASFGVDLSGLVSKTGGFKI